MASRGVHFAITRRQMNRFISAVENDDLTPDGRDEAVMELVEQIEAEWNREELFQTDKAWDGIHRCLTGDNTPKGRLTPTKGEYPLNLCVMGGEHLYFGGDYTVTLIEPEEVRDLARALKAVTEGWMRERFFKLKAKGTLYPITEAEFEYVWGNFQGLPKFVAIAAQKKRAVIFTVDH
jgi:hypothetical protein